MVFGYKTIIQQLTQNATVLACISCFRIVNKKKIHGGQLEMTQYFINFVINLIFVFKSV